MGLSCQEMFDIAYKGIVEQGSPARDNGSCLYRTSDGRHCAAGKIMLGRISEDSIFWEVIDDIFGVRDHYVGFDSEELPWDEDDDHFVLAIQEAHDNASEDNFVNDFKERMAKVAQKYNLTVPE